MERTKTVEFDVRRADGSTFLAELPDEIADVLNVFDFDGDGSARASSRSAHLPASAGAFPLTLGCAATFLLT